MGLHTDDLISAARDIPPVPKWEAANWRLRNACEVAVLAKLGLVNARILDDIARREDHAKGAHHLVAELAAWRELCGLDALAVQRENVEAATYQLPNSYSVCAQMLFDLGIALLNLGEGGAAESPMVPIATAGPDSIRSQAFWRPTNSGAHDWKAIVIEDVPTQMLRRSWFTTPDDGPIIVTPNGTMPGKQLDIWWGIHNGTHLDLISTLEQRSLRQLEMGSGLLLSEALSMCVEILAALETRAGIADYCPQVLGKGLIERADRLNWRDFNTGDAPYSEASQPSYWAALPQIAAAYVVAPIRLIGSEFKTAQTPGLDIRPLARRFHELSQRDDFTKIFSARASAIFNV